MQNGAVPYPAPGSVNYCPQCGKPVAAGANYCGKCGYHQASRSFLPIAPVSRAPEYAGFWLRCGAALIDGILLSIVNGIFGLVYLTNSLFGLLLVASDNNAVASEDNAVVEIIVFILYITINWLYFAIMECSAKQATLGKMAVGIVVTDLNGGRISFGRATGRHFGKFLSWLIIGIGYIMAGLTKKKQALHDVVSGCLVMRKSQKRG